MMLTKTWLDYFPLWTLLPATVLLVLASIEGGYRLALRRKRRAEATVDAPISSVIGGSLGLLAFLLAFTFGMAGSRFETRRELLLDEVNAINTCYLRAGMIPDSERIKTRTRLREYAHLRAEFAKDPQSVPETLARLEALQNELWEQALIVAHKDRSSEMYSLFVDSLNTVLESHTKRVVVFRYRIPTVIWLALYVVSILSMAGVGYQFGLAGMRDFAISLFLALSFSVVICLIADLERGHTGLLRVSQEPMIDLDHKLESSAL
jgi:hypothetical protein